MIFRVREMSWINVIWYVLSTVLRDCMHYLISKKSRCEMLLIVRHIAVWIKAQHWPMFMEGSSEFLKCHIFYFFCFCFSTQLSMGLWYSIKA